MIYIIIGELITDKGIDNLCKSITKLSNLKNLNIRGIIYKN